MQWVFDLPSAREYAAGIRGLCVLHRHSGSAAEGSPTQVPTNTRDEKWRCTMATPRTARGVGGRGTKDACQRSGSRHEREHADMHEESSARRDNDSDVREKEEEDNKIKQAKEPDK